MSTFDCPWTIEAPKGTNYWDCGLGKNSGSQVSTSSAELNYCHLNLQFNEMGVTRNFIVGKRSQFPYLPMEMFVNLIPLWFTFGVFIDVEI
jgi:hypothetical protein